MQSPRRILVESALTRALLAFTLFASAMFVADIVQGIRSGWSLQRLCEGVAFLIITGFLIYGNVGYQLTRLGHWYRQRTHQPATRQELDTLYRGPAPSLLFLVPSYKEELRTVRQTLMSAALQDFPGRRVTLLIDDPCRTTDREALSALEATRHVVHALSEQLHAAAQPYLAARDAFALRAREARGLVVADEARRLASLYESAALWLDKQASQEEQVDHTDTFFAEAILRTPARALRARGEFWQHVSYNPGHATQEQISTVALAGEYARLAVLFDVQLSSFERKRYENLSHEPNKAMNLNTYIGLIGGAYREVHRQGALHLEPAQREEAGLIVPEVDFLITLDADSLLLPEYALRLIHLMTRPGNERIAVAQTPYSAIPNPRGVLERIAGATTDIQYLVHQGFTQHRATYWVGANAVLRYAALQDIVVQEHERGYPIKRFIQDRTVIEDTESTVDLLCCGWTLYNYPERLAYSATPPDFGALAVQRARWANGGLIILPKLLRYLVSGPQRLRKMREGFFRVHYLTSIAGVNVGLVLMLAYPFPDAFQSPWLPAIALPYYLLYARDLWQSGYRGRLDIVRVYALNLLLLPVNLGGVVRSMHQAAMGHKIPFRRTPKVAGRTRVDAAYVAAEFAIAAACLLIGAWYGWQGHVAQAVFAFVNGALFVYGIHVFLGWRDALSDLRSGLDERVAPLLREGPASSGVSR